MIRAENIVKKYIVVVTHNSAIKDMADKVIYVKEVNRLTVTEGRLPEKAGEILAERENNGTQALSVGDTVTVLGETYTVVGIAANPLIFDRLGEPSSSDGETLGRIVYFSSEFSAFSFPVTDIYIRLNVVGGAGSLYVNPEHTVQVKDLESFPDIFKPLATNMGEALAELRKRSDVQWTYLSSAGDFVADGERTGEYLLGGEEYFVNDKGESRISYADYAIAMIDEIENANNIQKRFSVIGE